MPTKRKRHKAPTSQAHRRKVFTCKFLLSRRRGTKSTSKEKVTYTYVVIHDFALISHTHRSWPAIAYRKRACPAERRWWRYADVLDDPTPPHVPQASLSHAPRVLLRTCFLIWHFSYVFLVFQMGSWYNVVLCVFDRAWTMCCSPFSRK
jgi:hypothetical protein